MDYGIEHIVGNLLEEKYDDILSGTKFKNCLECVSGYDSDIICRRCSSSIN